MDGMNGWQYSSYEHFSDRLNAMLYQELLHQKLSENAQAGVVREYSSASFAGRISQVYETSLGSNFSQLSINS